MVDQYPPSYFANLGQPMCSRWSKSEPEWLALAYVQALAADGDTWKTLTRDQVFDLLTVEQRRTVHYALRSNDAIDISRFERVRNFITDSNAAFAVGGFWSKQRAEKINGTV